MTITDQATELIRSAYLFIAKKQTKSGGFISLTHTEQGQEQHHTTFYPALISSILAEIPTSKQSPEQLQINNRLKNFWLLQPRLAQPSWCTYWAIQDQYYHTLQYPPDVDDTSLVLISKQYLYTDTDLSEISADYVITLTKQEQKPGGPYRTWIGQSMQSPWTDYDPIVNATINYALSKWNVHVPTLQNYLIEVLKNDSWRSPYYTSNYLSLYLLVRSYTNDQQRELKKYFQEIINHEPPKTNLDYACATIICSRLQIAYPAGLEKKFFNMTSTDFIAEACIQEQPNAQSGCDALTAALWALAAAEIKAVPNSKRIINSQAEDTVDIIHNESISLVAKKLQSLDKNLFESSLEQFCKLIQTPIAREITLLNYDIGLALGATITKETYITLGVANLFGWLAFQWYDECYDEKVISSGLPLANICLRESIHLYSTTAEELQVNTDLIKHVFDNIDKAHATELATNQDLQADLKKGKKINFLPSLTPSERSFGHCLGALIVAKQCAIPETQYQQLRRLFSHYLNTRQLCDDLHDWHEDYVAKRLTSVTRYLFLTTQLFPHAATNQTQKIFWRDGLTQALTNARHELQQTISLLKLIDWPHASPTMLEQTISRLHQAINRASSERKTSQALLTHFEHAYESL